jgi:uncharacterized membrane protein (UPF0127 family)
MAVVLSILFITAFGIRSTLAEQRLPTITVFVTPNVKIEAELAYTDANRARGLMFRESLPEDAGMLFVFSSLDSHLFWMKNTLIPLDIFWLNERKEVVYIVTVPPCKGDPCESYGPLQKALYVLELNAGFAKQHKIQIGSQMEFAIPPEVQQKVRASAD